jgi:hypothetical protein
MIRSAIVVTGSLMLAVSSWAGQAAGGSFDDALGGSRTGVLVQADKAEPFAGVESGHVYLATDIHDAMVDAVEIDERLLEEGRIHSGLQGPIGPDDPSVTGELRPRPRAAANPSQVKRPGVVEQASVMIPLLKSAGRPETDPAADEDEPLLITDRVAEAEAIESAGSWVDKAKAAFTRLLNRQP